MSARNKSVRGMRYLGDDMAVSLLRYSRRASSPSGYRKFWQEPPSSDKLNFLSPCVAAGIRSPSTLRGLAQEKIETNEHSSRKNNFLVISALSTTSTVLDFLLNLNIRYYVVAV
jgi:hypothetical protein